MQHSAGPSSPRLAIPPPPSAPPPSPPSPPPHRIILPFSQLRRCLYSNLASTKASLSRPACLEINGWTSKKAGQPLPQGSGPGGAREPVLYTQGEADIADVLYDAASGGYVGRGCGEVSVGAAGGSGGRMEVCAVLRKNRGFVSWSCRRSWEKR